MSTKKIQTAGKWRRRRRRRGEPAQKDKERFSEAFSNSVRGVMIKWRAALVFVPNRKIYGCSQVYLAAELMKRGLLHRLRCTSVRGGRASSI